MRNNNNNPHAGRNYREDVRRYECVEERNLNLRKKRSKQRLENLLNEIKGCTHEEIERFERIFVERRGRAAAHVVLAPIGTAQPSDPRSRCLEISFDVPLYCSVTRLTKDLSRVHR